MDGLAESVGELMENAVGLAKNALPKMIDGLALVMVHAGEIKTAMLAVSREIFPVRTPTTTSFTLRVDAKSNSAFLAPRKTN